VDNSWFNAVVDFLADGLELATCIENVAAADVLLEERKENLGSLIVNLTPLG